MSSDDALPAPPNWRVVLADTTVGAEEIAAVTDVLTGRWLSTGPVTRAFEREFADTLGVVDAVAVNSGTAALHLALITLGVGPGDEVIMPALTFVASAAMTVAVGATPVFADVRSAHDLTIDPADVARRITGRTRAVVAMHYGGYPADVDRLVALAAKHGVALIEDAAHAPAVRYRSDQVGTGALGTFGDVGCFSFHPAKNLTTGEGGMVVARDQQLLAECRDLRSHCMTAPTWDRDRGLATGYDVTGVGFNYRPSEIASAIGRVQLRRLAADRATRARLVAEYRTHLGSMPDLVLPFTGRDDLDTAHHLFVIMLPPGVDRAWFRAALRDVGVQTSVHYPPTHQLSYYQQRWAADVTLPVTDATADRIVSLPLHARMSAGDATYVARAVVETLRGSGTS
ncbi:DegT/DnrJ/EryC1/StrS family aminotransferase [Micromonospora sp. NPDC049662]|uniref:DegT/DnrJ/EryC1/StrS family aminotransferase n=1 Tax=Micromonospora sp. NPDC049662 TaxID=3155397 RepID=UPI003439249A